MNTVLLAMCHAQLMREKMDEIERKMLTRIAYFPEPKWQSMRHPEGMKDRITDPKKTYLMNDSDSEIFHAERQQIVDSMGYNLPKGHCPALVAEDVLRKAEHLLIESAEPVFGISRDSLLSNFNNYRKYIDLLIKLVINLPDYKKPEIMEART